MPPPPLLPADRLDPLAARVLAMLEATPRGRVVVGISGAPGAGKTTLAQDLVRTLAGMLPPSASGEPAVAHLPMDGYHLADVQLDALGLRDRKGAPETFDAHGYLSTLERLRAGRPETVYVPGFERDIEQPLAAAIAIPASVRVVVSEGNYLLLPDDPWPRVRAQLDEVWFVELADGERLRRLVERHTRFGKEPDAAQEWALGPDQANAERVLATRDDADLVLVVPGESFAPS